MNIPPFVLFEKETDVECRSLIACAMGNDYWIGGQCGFGPAKANNLLQSTMQLFSSNIIERRNHIMKEIVSVVKSFYDVYVMFTLHL